jgi:metal-responsive CopG/Arc/MetJ family transcriptional regulator
VDYRHLNVESTVEYIPHMETVQIVVDKELLTAADKAARRLKQNRSALVREALREYLLRLEMRAREQRDREGYAKKPQALKESRAWEMEAAWPER